MNTPNNIGRRHFVRRLGALTSLGLGSGLNILDFIPEAAAQPTADYRALVCVFLFGGNDGNNTVIPYDTAGYASYSGVRTSASGIQLTQSSLLPIQPVSTPTPFALHPNLVELQTLFNQRKLAILANVGTLVAPTSKAQYLGGMVPLSLYSHSDQQAQWQSSISGVVSGTGWGGRIADKLAALNGAGGFPVVTSLGGSVLFTTGQTSVPLSIPSSGSFALAGYNTDPVNAARLAALKQFLASPSSNHYVNAANAIGNQALALSTTMGPILANTNSTVAPIFGGLANNNVALALYQVAKTIEARSVTGATRQIFFVPLGNFDTHSDQVRVQGDLLAELSPALKAFYDATVALGVSSQVTTFTLSDFGRTFQPASGAGTDHAWGNHHFIIGDAVKGGDMYGQYPTLALGGPSDAEGRGRWIPTTAVDQYGATLAQWLGVQSADLGSVFPNLAQFPGSDLGFMS